MKKYRKLFCILVLIFSARAYPQVENIPSDHPVYQFLSNLSVQGILTGFDDLILPFSRQDVIGYLEQLNDKKDLLSSTEKKILENLYEKIIVNNEAINFVSGGNTLDQKFTDYYQKHFYYYLDSSVTFFVDPNIEYSFIYSTGQSAGSNILNFGAAVYGSYDNWFGYRIKASNGAVLNNRTVALNDKRVEQSFTFNQTGINYFDGTEGYLRLHKGIVSLQLGRERIYWGRGNVDRIFLGDNPPLFDFLKFNIFYKKLSFDFMHGWLVQKPEFIFIDTIPGHYKFKDAKYFAVSRIGYNPSSSLSFGISQVVVYANRPFEAAYLNPFLFWESAQRSLNDLDNSFLGIDVGIKPLKGMQLDFSAFLDDINFDNLIKGKWNSSSNALALDIGGTFVSPILPKNFQLKLQYVQVRPYMFSHQGKGESLAYSNNGYVLGTNQPPNSIRLNSMLDFYASDRLSLSLSYSYTIHGRNIYDSGGKIIMNVGGNAFEPRTINDSETAYLLDGERFVSHSFRSKINYEILYGIYLNILYEYHRNDLNNSLEYENLFRAALILNWN